MRHFGLFAQTFTSSIFIAALIIIQPLLITPNWIIILLSCVMLSRLLWTIPQYKKHNQSMSNIHYAACMKLLQGSTPWFRSVFAYLGLLSTPIHLILSEEKSGKTQLLDGCELLNNSDKHCALYQKNNCFLIDTPGITVIEKSTWLAPLLKSLQACHDTHPLQSIILTVDVRQLTTATTKQILTTICKLTHDIFPSQKRPCIQIMVSKCDKLPYFVDKFDNINDEERKGLFGLLFKKKNVLTNPEQAFDKRFAQLTDHLEQFIQEEQDPLLLDFLGLHPALLQLTSTCSQNHVYLRSICFSSTRTRNPLFVDEWLMQKHVTPIKPKRINLYHTTLISFATLGLLTYNAWCIIATNHAQLKKLEHELHEPLSIHNPILLKLDHLAKANQLSNELPTPPIKLKSLISFEHDIATRYQKELNLAFKPWIKQQLESELIQFSSKTIKDFSVYMMLCDDRSRDDEAITEWFNDYWQKHISSGEQFSADQHLHALLAKPTLCALNHTLIEKTQDYLGKIPQEDLIVALTQNEVNSLTKKSHASAQTNSIYTYQQFHTVYDQKLLSTYQTLMKYKQQPQSDALLSRSKKRYLEKYQAYWQKALSDIQMPTFSTLSEADQALDQLQHASTSVSKRLHLILINTRHPEDNQFQNSITSPITAYPGSNQQLITKLDTWLDQLHTYVSHLNQAGKKTYVFEASKNRMLQSNKDGLSYLKQQIKDFPAPLSIWLDQLVQQAWRSMLSETLGYLNSEWKRYVLPMYQTLIENKYPLFSDTSEDIRVEDFQQFFEPSGLLAQFTEQKLSPFLQKDKSGWSWKKKDGLALAASPQSAENLMKAAAIQKMFFSSKEAQAPLLQWQLQPESFSSSLKSLDILASQQTLSLTNSNLKQHSIHITIPMKAPSITLTFTNTHQLVRSQVFQGPWAWLRAMQNALPKASLDGKTTRFTLTFKSNDTEAKMTAFTQLAMNPLTTGILDGFRCPKQL